MLSTRRRPALVIWGEQDPFIPSKHAQDQRQAFPDAEIHMFEDSGHWPFIDNPDRTRDLFVAFLQPRLAAGRPRAREGARRLRVPVAVDGVLPAYDVRARLGRKGSSTRQTVAGRLTLLVRLRRPLRTGRHVVTVTARGLPARRVAFRVRARPAQRGPSGGRGEPRFTG